MGSYWRDCRSCGAKIIMAEDSYGNWQPLDPGGGRHECSSGYSNQTSSVSRTVFLYTYKESDDFCRPTKCPHCGEEVFFVRHNGGSVWFDSLGKPWPKHRCFDESSYQTSLRFILPVSEAIQSPNLGLVIRIKNQPPGFFARIDVYLMVVKCENGEFVFVHINGIKEPDTVIGSLVIVSRHDRKIYLNGKVIRNVFHFHIGKNEKDGPKTGMTPDATSITIWEPPISPHKPEPHKPEPHKPDPAYSKELVQCEMCKVLVRRSNLKKHMRKVHNKEEK